MFIGACKRFQLNLEAGGGGRSNVGDVEVMEAAREAGLLDDASIASQSLSRLFLVPTTHAGHLATGTQRARRCEWLVDGFAVTSYISRVEWLSPLHLEGGNAARVVIERHSRARTS